MDLGAEPPRIKIFQVHPPPPSRVNLYISCSKGKEVQRKGALSFRSAIIATLKRLLLLFYRLHPVMKQSLSSNYRSEFTVQHLCISEILQDVTLRRVYINRKKWGSEKCCEYPPKAKQSEVSYDHQLCIMTKP